MENVHADLRVWSVNLVIFLLVMVSIWEGNQCKKAQLTLMEISAAIANKVVSHVFSFFTFKLFHFVSCVDSCYTS